jgi:hypothetical protein
MIRPGKRLSAESIRAFRIALFGEDWQTIMSHELNVDRSIVGSWATQGPPAERADALRHEEIVICIIADLLHSCARDRIGDVIRAAQSLHEAERTPA